MQIYALFGQREEQYPGQYAPECLAAMDEFSYHENALWLEDKKEEAVKDPDMMAVKVFSIDLGSEADTTIRGVLLNTPELSAVGVEAVDGEKS